MKFTIGADPELFLHKNGKAVTAHGVVQGTKEHPYPVEYGAYQVDGMAVEFNIDPTPLDGDFAAFGLKIHNVMSSLENAVLA